MLPIVEVRDEITSPGDEVFKMQLSILLKITAEVVQLKIQLLKYFKK